MTVNLRPYQQAGVADIRAAFAARNRAVLYVLPTGGGKTYTFVYIGSEAGKKGNPVLILEHRKELIRQSSLSLASLGVFHQVVAPPDKIAAIRRAHVEQFGRPYINRTANIAVASVQTLARRFSWLDQFRPALIVVDEAHHATAGTWARVLEHADYARILGVTATPARTDGQGLGSDYGGCFDAMVHGPTMRELIEMGNLVPPRVFSPPPRFDTSNLHHQGGDYKKDELAAATDDRSITGDAVDHYRRIAPGRPAIVFCVNVQHAEHVAAQFRESGFRFEILIGDMDDALRDERIRMLADGRLQGLVTVDVISEGTDIPVAEVAIMLRATESLVLFLQQAGRVLRPCPEMGKTHGIILDHVGNVGQFVDGQFRVKHGMPDADREWSLEGKPKRAGKKKDEEPDLDILQCPACYGVDYPRKVCGLPLPGGGTCDHVFEARQMKPIQQTDGELREITEDEAETLRKEQRRQQGAARTLEQLQAAGMGRKQAEHVLKAREEKAQLRNDLTALLKTYRERHGDPVTDLGIGQVDVGRMKPKALRESIELVSDAIFQAPRQERLTG
jgi:superfamily II DNA or RNA helicase